MDDIKSVEYLCSFTGIHVIYLEANKPCVPGVMWHILGVRICGLVPLGCSIRVNPVTFLGITTAIKGTGTTCQRRSYATQ